jgi:hypothetical protein
MTTIPWMRLGAIAQSTNMIFDPLVAVFPHASEKMPLIQRIVFFV